MHIAGVSATTRTGAVPAANVCTYSLLEAGSHRAMDRLERLQAAFPKGLPEL
jgi:hypothetical protein